MQQMTSRGWHRAAVATLVLAGAQSHALAASVELYAAPDGSGSLCTLEAPCSLVQARDQATFGFAVATSDAFNSITVKVDGAEVGKLELPNTGGYSTFQTVPLLGVPMVPGPHIVTLEFGDGISPEGFNLDYFNYEWCEPGTSCL